jgi:hypothetical protein
MTDYQQPTYPPPPTYSYPPAPVNRHEGLAVAALVLGIIGVVFGVIPLTFWIALPCGALALIFGIIGRRPTKGKWGVALGAAALALGVIGAAIVNSAVNDLNKALDTSTVDTSVLGATATEHTVVYAIDGAESADVTFQTPSGITQQQAVTLPWTDIETMGTGDVPIISAQDTGGGYVVCVITVDGVEVASNTGSGLYAIASCNGDMLGY